MTYLRGLKEGHPSWKAGEEKIHPGAKEAVQSAQYKKWPKPVP